MKMMTVIYSCSRGAKASRFLAITARKSLQGRQTVLTVVPERVPDDLPVAILLVPIVHRLCLGWLKRSLSAGKVSPVSPSKL